MHGRKKSDQPHSETELSHLQRKTEIYSRTVKDIMARKLARDYSQDSLDITGKLLKSNPDFYSVWNFRKEILNSMNADLSACSPHKDRIVSDGVRDRELKLSEDCIRKNPKSYGAWHHRQWILERIETDYASELELCRLFLMEDQRNFHCWCFRRLVVQVGGVEAEEEFRFSGEKIDENFSNYSAFHHRSVYIQKLGHSPRDIVEGEFSIIENAIYTEPDDQSSWWYHQFLLTWIAQRHQKGHQPRRQGGKGKQGQQGQQSSSGDCNGSDSDDRQWFRSVLDQQISVMRGLLEVEANSKWAMSALSMMLELVLKFHCEDTNNGIFFDSSGSTVEAIDEERQQILRALCEVDPYHVNRYKYLQRRKYSLNAALE